MSNPGVPVGQDAYQAILVTKYSAALRPFAQTANRYGGGSTAWNLINGMFGPPSPVPMGPGRWMFGAGQAVALPSTITSAGGAGYVIGDLVTFVSVNGGRPIVGKVLSVAGGNPTGLTILDQGSGLIAGGNGVNSSAGPGNLVIAQASTSGVGIAGVWTIGVFSFGWLFPQPNSFA